MQIRRNLQFSRVWRKYITTTVMADSYTASTDESGQSQGTTDSTSPPSGTLGLPIITSAWTRDNIEELKIYIDESTHKYPLSMVKLLIGNNLSRVTDYVDKITDAIQNTLAYQFLDCPFDDLTVGKSIIEKLAIDNNNMWNVMKDIEEDPKLKTFKKSYEVAGKDFTERLISCIDLKEKNETVSEMMFQHLFISFLQLFSIRCQFEPCSELKHINIKGRNVSGKADVTVQWMKFHFVEAKAVVDWKTLVVCDVKKEFKRGDRESSSKRQRLSSQMNVHHPTVPDNVLGQHGAQLLLYHQLSFKDDLTLGMIVEKTHITFTALSMTQNQYQKLLNGTLKDDTRNGPKLFITQSYDYLVHEDRRQLTRALVTLGYLQNYGSEFCY